MLNGEAGKANTKDISMNIRNNWRYDHIIAGIVLSVVALIIWIISEALK